MQGSPNIIVLDKPIEVNSVEWGYAHPNCNALFYEGTEPATMYLVAYARNEQGNYELQMIKRKNRKYKLFAGVDDSMLNFIGDVR